MKTFTMYSAIALLTTTALCAPAIASEAPQSTLSLTTTGVVSARPDQAVIGFAVHSTSEHADQAMQENNIAMDRAIKSLVEAGVDEDDIATTSLALNPRYNHYQKSDGNTPPVITGYEAHNKVSATVREIDSLGSVLDGLVKSGVNGIENVSFEVENSEKLMQEARIEAARKARIQAETYANAIGTTVTGIISMSENQQGGGPQPYAMRMVADSVGGSVPVAGGMRDIKATVNVVFSLDGKLKP